MRGRGKEMFLNSTVYPPQRTKPRVLALISVLLSLAGGMGGGGGGGLDLSLEGQAAPAAAIFGI
jgi:hypothetical protein